MDVPPSTTIAPPVYEIITKSESQTISEKREPGSDSMASERSEHNHQSETMLSEKRKSASGAKTSQESKMNQNKTDQLLDIEPRSDKVERDTAKIDSRKVLGNRFRQGALAVVAMARLEKMVKRSAPPPSSPIHEMLSSSSRLMEMYSPSDEENEDDANSTGSDNDSSESSSCDANSDCPVCLDLVDPSQQRKIILLRRMLCKRCFDTYYLKRGVENGGIENKSKDFNTKRDVQTLISLRGGLSSTDKSPIIPVLPM